MYYKNNNIIYVKVMLFWSVLHCRN